MPIGIGAQPAGSSGAGYGVASSAIPLKGRITPNDIGRSTGARFIDARKGDYVINEDGRCIGMTPGQQAVYLAAKTVRGTSAVKSMGQTLSEIEVITENAKSAVEQKLNEALQPAVDGGLITIVDFDNFKAGPRDGLIPGRMYGRLRWRDLSTSKEHTEYV